MSRADVEKSRETGAARQRKSRGRRAEDGPVTRDSHEGAQDMSQRPYPTLPYPTQELPSGGDLTLGDAGAMEPPLYSDHCEEHAYLAWPPKCGQCADKRRSRLQVVPSEPWLERCLVHMLSHTGTCPGCAADEKGVK